MMLFIKNTKSDWAERIAALAKFDRKEHSKPSNGAGVSCLRAKQRQSGHERSGGKEKLKAREPPSIEQLASYVPTSARIKRNTIYSRRGPAKMSIIYRGHR